MMEAVEEGRGQEGPTDPAAHQHGDPRVVLLNKPPGLTPLAAIERLRKARPDQFGDDVKVGYAGRLDPLARGLLVCLAGPAGGPPLALQKTIETQAKVYEFQVLFGVTTDTYDVMGMVQEAKEEEEIPAAMEKRDEHERRTTDRRRRREEEDGLDGGDGDVAEPAPKKTATESGKDTAEERQCVNPLGEENEGNDHQLHSVKKECSNVELEAAVRAILPSFVGKRSQAYPPFSSARVKGKPLFHWARQGAEKMKEIAPLIPKIEVEIRSLELLSTYTITTAKLREEIWAKIGAVTGDFRQKEILQSWDDRYFKNRTHESVLIFQMRAEVTSGTYIRSLAHDMGQRLGMGALAFDIYRTRVGSYTIEEAISV